TIELFRENGNSLLCVINATSSTLKFLNYGGCTGILSSTLQNPPSFSLSAPGTYSLKLICNEGLFNQSTHCKNFVVKAAVSLSVITNPGACTGAATVYANGSGTNNANFQWLPSGFTG